MRHLMSSMLLLAACASTVPAPVEQPRIPEPREVDEVELEVVNAPVSVPPSLPGPRLVVQTEHTDSIAALRLVRDDTLVFTAGADGALKLRDRQGHLIWSHQTRAEVVAADISADGLVIGAVTRNGRAFVLPIGGEPIHLTGPEPHVTRIALSDDGEQVVTAATNGSVTLWSPTGERLERIFAAGAAVWAVAISRDGRVVAAGDADGRVWTRVAGQPPESIVGHAGEVSALALDPSGERLASASQGRADPQSRGGSAGTNIKLWRAGELVTELPSPRTNCIRFSADGDTLVSAGLFDRTVRVWRNGDVREIEAGLDERRRAALVDVSADGGVLVTASDDLRVVQLWSEGQLVRDLTLFEPAWTTSVAFGPDGRLVAGGWDGRARVWSPDGSLINATRRARAAETIDAVAVSPDGRFIATGSECVGLWTSSGDPVQPCMHATTHHAGAVAFSADGERVISGDGEGKMFIWKAGKAPRRVRIFGGHRERVYALALSPDGAHAVSGAPFGELKLWQNDFRKSSLLAGHGEYAFVYAVAWAPDGQKFASAGGGSVRLWSRDGEPLATIDISDHNQSNVGAVDIAPSGEVAASVEDEIRIWRDGELRTVLRGHTNTIYALAYSPDGRLLASGGRDGGMRLWCVDSGESIELIARVRQLREGAVRPDADWMVLAADQWFIASPGASDLVAVADGLELVTDEQALVSRIDSEAMLRVLRCGAAQNPRHIDIETPPQRSLPL